MSTHIDHEPHPLSNEPLPTFRPRRTRTRVFEARLSELTRSLNQQVAALHHSSAFNEYLCECGRKTCRERVVLSNEEYGAVRSRRTQFVIAAGHRPVGAQVVQELAGCEVIELAQS